MNIRELHNDIINILEPYKLNSYFNLSFYQMIKKYSFCISNTIKLATLNSLFNFNNVCCIQKEYLNVPNIEYILIYQILNSNFYISNYMNKAQQAIKRQYINKYYYQLTGLVGLPPNKNIITFEEKIEYFWLKNFNDINTYHLQFNIDILNSDILNCNDTTFDDVHFNMFYHTGIEGEVNKKNKYTENDIKILKIITNKTILPYHNFNTILSYTKYIFNFYKHEVYEDEELQEVIIHILEFIQEFGIKNEDINFLVKYANYSTLNYLIKKDILNTNNYQFIDPIFINPLLKTMKNNFKALIKLSALR